LFYICLGDASFHRRISIPTLLIYGLKDPLVSLVEMCEMERTIPKSYLELVPLAGHMIMLEQPKELNLMMRRFIEKYLEKATLAAS
jgi:abhydrolase domain-containing protein 8